MSVHIVPLELSPPLVVVLLAFLVLGALHAAELLGVVTIPLLREVEKKVDRLGALAAQHAAVVRRIAAKLRRWWRRRPH
jgi:hypothetical protein